MKCVVHAYGYRAGEARAKSPYGHTHHTYIGSAQYGMRYDEVELTIDARKRLMEAYRLTMWYDLALGGRLEPGVELPDVGQS